MLRQGERPAFPLWQEQTATSKSATPPASPRNRVRHGGKGVVLDADAAPAGAGAAHWMDYLPSFLNREAIRSRLSWLITSNGISLGQTAEHSPMFVQPPKPSASCWPIIPLIRR